MFDKNEMDQMRGLMHEVVQDTVPQIVGEALEQVVLPQIQGLREEIAEIRAVMVTKDYLEDRLADFRASLNHSADWFGLQLKRLTNILYQRQLLTTQNVIEIHGK